MPGSTNAGDAPSGGPVPRALPRLLRWIQTGTLGAGVALLVFFAGAMLDRSVARGRQLSAFEAARDAAPDPAGPGATDQSLWSEGRIAKYRESLSLDFAPPLAVLRIPRLGLEVPVLPGIDELTLNRAVGAIPGTAAPGESGNVGIAGHRDGYFRGLKDLESGDRLELETLDGIQEFRVTSIRIVDPSEVHVLAPTPRQVVTLVTCYPFYFVGKAPRRYIVQAEAQPSAGASEARQNR
ncbi:MAG: class D sortase [Thermoanaerobaculia bacterium]|jgi:sortase A|nr:class D sortase [Thermoanaerobaculia bacterium]MBP9823018.1 class D sortase [Thermoanaerobaculia bacterium]